MAAATFYQRLVSPIRVKLMKRTGFSGGGSVHQLSCPLPYMLPAGPQTTDPQLMLGCRKAGGRGEGNALP